MTNFLHVLSFIAVAISIFVSLGSVWHSVFALRAKTRAAVLMQDRSWRPEHLDFKTMNPHELEVLTARIESELQTLEENDRKIIQRGLLQPNRLGAQRFAQQVLGAAAPPRDTVHHAH